MDLVFRPAEPLRRLYPKLVQLGMTSFSSADVMRFLGKKTTLQGNVPGTLTAAVCSDLKRRPEGVRIKHSLGINSVKLYDKAYTQHRAVLRAEITINAANSSGCIGPKREIRKGRWSGAACGAVLPACTVARKSPSKRWTAIGMP
jgi:hypothetical protein